MTVGLNCFACLDRHIENLYFYYVYKYCIFRRDASIFLILCLYIYRARIFQILCLYMYPSVFDTVMTAVVYCMCVSSMLFGHIYIANCDAPPPEQLGLDGVKGN